MTPQSTIYWIPASLELPKRDVPVIVAVHSPTQSFTAVSHRTSRAWAGIAWPAAVAFWAKLPPPPPPPIE